MFARIVLLSGVCLFLLPPAFAQEKGDKPSTTAKPPPASQGAVTDVGPGISPPQVIFQPDPDYPMAACKRKQQGTCVLALVVDENGQPRDVHVIRSVNKVLDQNAIDAVTHWKFKPALTEGKPVAVRTSVEVGFRLY
jgi:TonB family protein